VEPGFGISLQNRGHGFTPKPGANQVAPGKRPFHTIIPAFLTKDGQPVMSFGVMGGNMQPQGHMQTLVRMLDYGQNPQAACDAPRWRFNEGLEINVEPQMDRGTVQGLQGAATRSKSSTTATRTSAPASSSGAWATPSEEGYAAASDPRRDGKGGNAAAWGALLVFLSAVSYAGYLVYSGELVKRLGSLRLVGLATTVACVLCILQFVLLRPMWRAFAVAPEVVWLSLLNATLCTAVPVLMVMMAIERIGAAVAAQTGMVGPLSTILMGCGHARRAVHGVDRRRHGAGHRGHLRFHTQGALKPLRNSSNLQD
jgi:hypothetical protein